MKYQTNLIFDLPETGDNANRILRKCDVIKPNFAEFYGEDLLRQEDLDIPNLSEIQVLRHYTNMSSKNFGVENGPYPLGSCTMKYNPKVNENMANLPGFRNTHPLQPVETVQGNLTLLYNLEQQLNDILGMDYFTFQPSAGAHGELTGIMMIKAYHEANGDFARKVMLIPDSAHGTNPASAAMAEFEIREIKSNTDGLIDVADLKQKIDDKVAGIMLTNPNTLGLFEKDVQEITGLVHAAGGLCYYDGANANAILMQTRPGDMGFDVVHLNVHKTFGTPHGGGGPGAGPVGIKKILEPFLPKPVIKKTDNSNRAKFILDYDRPQSIGKVRAFTGSFSVCVKTYAYILAYGRQGLAEVSEAAVANARYLLERVRNSYHVPYNEPAMHEFVITAAWQKEKYGVITTDIAKRLIDYGYHPPTVYFPLIVPEAMMVEPTDTETLEGLEGLADAFNAIAEEAVENPELLKNAPHDKPITRPDETKAARNPILKA
ncbi:MAG TPA: aminomethyl-transferring glycine dehydrogenase subunit GcvPB [Clostridiaceae bacterium]|jgi:glycine dehydrogenase subunit 2|nr:aminomethyl-transferring glycine dehydrogenase subunit GcvPB [Clostridiaceae bacterium]